MEEYAAHSSESVYFQFQKPTILKSKRRSTMKLFDNGLGSGGGLLVGAGIVILAPIVVPVVATLLKTVTKAMIKGSMIAYHKAKIAAEETMEDLEDIAAEARAEVTRSAGAAE
jgi:hypothetical protein